VKREYIFLACLVVLAALLFGWGARAGVVLQGWLRGAPVDQPAPAVSTVPAGGSPAGAAAAWNGVSAPVYSQYPFNLKNELTIAAGSADGIGTGDAAVADGFLIGVVTEASANSATVRTIFDGRFQLPVRIGVTGADALLRGGNDPRLMLIAVDAPVGERDEVRSAASGMPYGLPLGSLQGLHDSADKAFREASLLAPVDPAALRQVTVIPYE
jgi:cell shape-determining protein MreC